MAIKGPQNAYYMWFGSEAEALIKRLYSNGMKEKVGFIDCIKSRIIYNITMSDVESRYSGVSFQNPNRNIYFLKGVEINIWLDSRRALSKINHMYLKVIAIKTS